ncbi:hypothetical protein [Aquimarina sp. 2304DJ70-9]|uniref:hypothetical protein n=1 Tax=Aquimarina penaris TaxID=3231044 RepID=UPI0034624FF0
MDHKHIEVTPEQFQEFSTLPLEGAFQMLNLLKFKTKVEDADITGAQAYGQYMQAVLPFFQASKAKIIYQGKPMFTLIGPEKNLEWDKVLIVEYASKKDFLGMITSEGYPAKMRSRALQDSRLIVCTAK